MDVLSFFSPCKSHFEVEVKEAPPSKKRGRFHWSDYLDKKLIEEIKTQGISSYPFYLRKINGLSKWRLLSLHTEFGFSPKQLKDRFYESISDKLDKSNFSEEEDACILEEVSKYKESSSIKWGEISVELFKRFSGPGGLYRSSLQIKNQYHLLKTSLLKPKSAPVEKKVRLTEISSERVDCEAKPERLLLSVHKDPITGCFSLRAPLEENLDFSVLSPSVCSPFNPTPV